MNFMTEYQQLGSELKSNEIIEKELQDDMKKSIKSFEESQNKIVNKLKILIKN
jgi:hypothetical protein